MQSLQPRRFGRHSTVYRDHTTMELLKTYQDHFLQLTASDHSSQRMVELFARYGLSPNPRTSIAHWEASQEGCNKLRTKSISKRQRSSLWVYMCMDHQTIVGFHVMAHGEGRRDCVLPLYKFKKDPPQVLFCDTACHCEESGMNWLPHYYQNVKMFHAIFHGYQHLCSGTFDSRRSPKYNRIQTSLVEQCNSYLQSLRGVAKSGTMKLSTFMFWIEVFVVEWNYRKMN